LASFLLSRPQQGKTNRNIEAKRVIARTPYTPTACGAVPGGENTLWNDRMGSALMQTIPRSLVFTVSGDCDYDRVVELCFTIGKRTDQPYERVVIDFRWLEKAEGEAMRFMVNQLSELAKRRKSTLYLVKVPQQARDLFRRAPGGDEIRFVRTLEEAVLA